MNEVSVKHAPLLRATDSPCTSHGKHESFRPLQIAASPCTQCRRQRLGFRKDTGQPLRRHGAVQAGARLVPREV